MYSTAVYETIEFFFLQDPLIEPLIWPAIFDTLVIPPGLVEGLGRIARELNVNVQVKY